MSFFLRLFGSRNGHQALNRPFRVTLKTGDRVPAVYVSADEDPLRVLQYLRIDGLPRPAVFITGGAGNMSDQDKQLTRKMFEDGIAPYAEKHQIVVVDGATESGVIEMMATARRKKGYTFPLVGIAPLSKIGYPGKPNPSPDDAPLCAGHSHFVFVTGDQFGAESDMIINMTHLLAGGTPTSHVRRVPAAAIVINGGQITRQEAEKATHHSYDMPLVVLEGSGRFADELATAARTGETSQALLRGIIQRGNVHLVSPLSGPAEMQAKLAAAFAAAQGG